MQRLLVLHGPGASDIPSCKLWLAKVSYPIDFKDSSKASIGSSKLLVLFMYAEITKLFLKLYCKIKINVLHGPETLAIDLSFSKF